MNLPLIRWFFLAIALAALIRVIIKNWNPLVTALATLSWQIAAAGFLLAVVYIFFTLWPWRVILADLGSPLDWSTATQLFGISQVGKYIPDGVWNIVAATKIGRDHNIPARRSVTAMTVAVLSSLLTGTGIGVITIIGTSVAIQAPTWAILPLLIALIALLMSPVLNRLIAFGFNLFEKPAPERQISFKSLGLATLLAVIAWRIAGIQIWLLAYGFGMDLSISNMALSIGAYALAWVAGFLVVFVPAGTGVREGVLGLLFAGSLSSEGILAVVLVSRITMTFADLAFAGAGALLRMSNKR